MYLQKLEIQGFKSFVQKTTLEFNRQLTAIVGPNGSGKSNIADAVRWVLGEQSLKLLRGKRAEDVIFAGSDTKSRLGMAEASLYLNNEDGQAPVDYSEIVITRRVYRDGQGEYLLNRTLVRLQDIQLLLAQANFGQKTYSVIGQGMVDSILLASPAERKEFFEEATGVKQYQLKREQAIAKLTSTLENVEQAQALLNEIEPRLRALTRQVKRLERREELEQELRELQKSYYRFRYHELERRRQAAATSAVELQKKINDRQAQITLLQQNLERLERDVVGAGRVRELEAKQHDLRQRLAQLMKQQAVAEAQVEIAHLKRGEGELVLLQRRRRELEDELKHLESRGRELAMELVTQQSLLQGKVAEQARVVSEFGRHQGEVGTSWLERELGGLAWEHAELRRKLVAATSLMELKAVAAVAGQIEERLQAILKRLQRTGHGGDEDWARQLTARDQVVQEVASLKEHLVALEREQQAVATSLGRTRQNLDELSHSLASQGNRVAAPPSDIKTEITNAESELSRVEQELLGVRGERDSRSAEAFNLQRELTSLGGEQRQLEQAAHEVGLELVRLETKLEDLDRELAQEVPPELVHSIKEPGKIEAVDEGATALELQKLKHQLELTGGIEPEVVSEYQQTKTRYDFITTQLSDLEQAATSLESIIRDLDSTIERKFLASFKAINEKFVKYFQVLFSGGRATLVLQKEEPTEAADTSEEIETAEMAEAEAKLEPSLKQKFLAREKVRATLFAGVEIQATPPGKKLSSITALSGGEKALTAIALISSIISNNPSPFVVLDEVDAALDEANSERYAAIIDSLMDRTQFITITHNRATMKRASILYGITMGEDGASRLLSVRFDEADEIAAKTASKSKKK